jgi:hypothetical protein
LHEEATTQGEHVNRPILVSLCLLFVSAAIPGAESVGQVVYLEGSPELVRDGTTLYETLDYGYPVENFDSFSTDSESYLEIELDAGAGPGGTIEVMPDTDFFLEFSGLPGERATTLELLGGSVSVVARELAGLNRLQVRTLGSAAGVRGTTFNVEIALGGELLVSADEGLVEVTGPEGIVLFAAPGEAVEIDEAQGIARNLEYGTGSAAAFRREWLTGRNDAFLQNPDRTFERMGRRYLESRARFTAAYTALMARRTIIDRWADESRRGVFGMREDLEQDTAQMADDLRRIREAMRDFQHMLVRLERMSAYARQRLPRIADQENRASVRDLLNVIDLDRAVMRRRLAVVRHALKLNAERLMRLNELASQ